MARTRNGLGHLAGVAADGDLALGHDLEQGRLHLGRGPVDLVGQHDVGEHRAPLDVELLPRRPPDAGADDVGRHQVGGELEAGERAADDLGHGRHGEGLGQPGDALDQAVAAGQQADEGPLDHAVLADDDPLDLEQGVLEQRGAVLVGRCRPAERRRSGPWCSLGEFSIDKRRCGVPLGWTAAVPGRPHRASGT